MYCPNPTCYESHERPQLFISERSGIEIDYCPRCRGVWLDRGELDKLIERAQADINSEPVVNRAAEAYQAPHDYHDASRNKEHRYQEHHYKNQKYGHYGKRKKSILSEIFDF